jgi:hypothetical protein
METQIGIPSSLISEPKKDNTSLTNAQLGFMNLFAIPLFQGVADILPSMQYTVDQLEANKEQFQRNLQELPEADEARKRRLQDGARSPRSMSIAIIPGDSLDSSSGTTLEPSVQTLPENHAEMKNAGSSPPDQPQHIPNTPGEYKELNGISGDFDSVADFAASDPFNIGDGENQPIGYDGKQRCSETTEGSNSMPCSGDWASQATSATTGKMPLSPSTQGTSIVSQESLERLSSVPASTVAASETHYLAIPLPPMEPVNSDGEHSNGSTLRSDKSPNSEKSLKKKPSRFRMNALKLFRRDKNSTSPTPGGEAGG